jgi:DNA-damage-inducible protein J
MATARISVNVDEEVKQNAQTALREMGLDLTSAIDSFLRTIIREGRVPYEIRTEQAYREAAHKEYIKAELEKSLVEAADPNTKRISQADMMAELKQQREARNHV